MKWKNEYIVGIIWNRQQFVIAMTIVISEDSGAQEILSRMIKLAVDYISAQVKVQINVKDINFQFVSMVKQKLQTEDED